MKDKEDRPSGTPQIRGRAGEIARKHRQFLKTLLIISCIAYLLWSHQPGSLRRWNKPWLTEDELWLQEIVGLMRELYELLEEMRYLKRGSIAYPPHQNLAINTTLTALLGLSGEAVTLLQILPYVTSSPGPFYGFRDQPISSATHWRAWRYDSQLLLATRIADMRDDQALRNTRDPWYGDHNNLDDEEFLERDGDEALLKPWQVALSGTGRISSYRQNDTASHGGIMVLDLLARRLWTVGAGAVPARLYNDGSIEDRGSIDPATKGQLAEGETPRMGHGVRARIEMYASRPATEALRDYINRFRTLEWVPGFQEGDSMIAWPRDAYRQMYIQHGWPSHFHGDAFEKTRIAWDKEKRARHRATEPMRQVKSLEWSRDNDKEAIAQWREDLAALDLLDPDVKANLYDPKMKTDRHRAKEQTLEAIGYRGKHLAETEDKLVEMRKKADQVSPEIKKEREEVIAKYGLDYDLEFVWEHVEYD